MEMDLRKRYEGNFAAVGGKLERAAFVVAEEIAQEIR
jgi:hypothetical protein